MIVKRDIETAVKTALSRHKIIVLLGSRQVGKTTLVKELMPCYPNPVYLNLDDLSLQRRLSDEPDALQKILEESFRLPWASIPQGAFVALDECQKVPPLLDQVKGIYDSDPKKFRWVLTGSSALAIKSRSAESLAGRAFYFHLFPFSWHEILTTKDQGFSSETAFLPLLLDGSLDQEKAKSVFLKYRHESDRFYKILDEVLVFGSFPEVILTLEEEGRWLLLNNYHKTYLERDILQLSQVGDWKGFAQLTEVAAAANNNLVRISDLCQQTGLARDTVKRYLSILEQSFLVYDIPVFSRSPVRRTLKSSKFEWTDQGLVSFLTRAADLATLKATGAIGSRLENWVINQFQAATKNQPFPLRLSYWKTVSGMEVDLILERENKICPIEIKYANRIAPQDLKGLKAFREERKKEIGFLSILYRGPYFYNEEEKIHYLPIWGLF